MSSTITRFLRTLSDECYISRDPDRRAEQELAYSVDSNALHLRVNLVGYLEDVSKVTVLFSHRP